jgi:Flp pilus assembly protein TadG
LSAIVTRNQQRLVAIDLLSAVGTQEPMGISVMLKLMQRKLAAYRRKTGCALGRLLRQQDGAAAVEFGMVAAPFLALLFAIMETALTFFAGQTLETALADSSRLIMTGQAQSQSLTQATFKDAVCARIYGLFDCSKVYVDVRTLGSFGAAVPPPLDADGNYVPMQYSPGGPSDIVVVRLFYQWPVYVSLLDKMGTGGKRLLVATAAFRNEPYGS